MLAAPDQQISLADPDARSMATSGRGTGLVGYNVQTAVDTKHHLIVAHEVTNVGHDRGQLASMGKQAKAAVGAKKLKAVTDRGYFKGEELKACEDANIETYLPKPQTSNAQAKGRFGRRDFIYHADNDEYECPAGERAKYRFSREENGRIIRRYWTSACPTCSLKSKCTPSPYRRIPRWEHEAVVERAQARLDKHPEMMRIRRETAEHPFGTIKGWMGSQHFKMIPMTDRNRDESGQLRMLTEAVLANVGEREGLGRLPLANAQGSSGSNRPVEVTSLLTTRA